MHSEEPSPFTPPAASRTPIFLLAVGLVLAALALGRWGGWWPTAPAAAPVASPRVLPAIDADPRLISPRAPPKSIAQSVAPAPLQWVRCEANGRVTYSDGRCAGATQKSSSATTQAALSTVPSTPSAVGSTTVFRCTGYNGAVFWSSTHCNQKQALIDRMVSVPRGLSFQQQIALAERSMFREPTVVARAPLRPSPDAEDRQVECKALDEHVRVLDAQARQPHTAAQQDWLREKRKKARDRQFALHC